MRKRIIIAGACLVGVLAAFAVTFALTAMVMIGSETELEINGTTEIDRGNLTDRPIIYLPANTLIPAADAIAGITVSDASGSPIPLSPDSSQTMESPSGLLRSVARVELAPVGNAERLTFRMGPSLAGLRPGDALVANEIVRPLLLIVLGCAATNGTLVAIGVIAVKGIVVDALKT